MTAVRMQLHREAAEGRFEFIFGKCCRELRAMATEKEGGKILALCELVRRAWWRGFAVAVIGLRLVLARGGLSLNPSQERGEACRRIVGNISVPEGLSRFFRGEFKFFRKLFAKLIGQNFEKISLCSHVDFFGKIPPKLESRSDFSREKSTFSEEKLASPEGGTVKKMRGCLIFFWTNGKKWLH